MSRIDGRTPKQLRKVKIIKDYVKHADGSCLIAFGDTRVICTAVVEDGVPPFLKNSGTGWVTAEYGMIPCSTNTRIRRDKAAASGRTFEIQRLIGRSIRSVVQLDKLGERTLKIDCDVIQADGGTRTAAITGSFIALALAFRKLKRDGKIKSIPLSDFVAAISVGIVKGHMLLDLNYEEDSKADMDMNVVMIGKGEFVEVQGTAERNSFSRKELDKLTDLAKGGIKRLITMQRNQLKGLEI